MKKWAVLGFLCGVLTLGQWSSPAYSMPPEDEEIESAEKRPSEKGSACIPEEILSWNIFSQMSSDQLIALGRVNQRWRGCAQEAARKDGVDLSAELINDEKFRNIFSDTGIFNRILSLNLSGSRFNHQLLSVLPPSLIELVLNQCEIDASDIRTIRERLPNLKILRLRSNKLGLNEAVELGQMTSLTTLDLGNNQIESQGASEIAKLVQLQSLDLSRNGLNQKAVNALVQLKNLRSFIVINNRIGVDGIVRLVAELPELKVIGLFEKAIFSETVINLEEQYRHIQFRFYTDEMVPLSKPEFTVR